MHDETIDSNQRCRSVGDDSTVADGFETSESAIDKYGSNEIEPNEEREAEEREVELNEVELNEAELSGAELNEVEPEKAGNRNKTDGEVADSSDNAAE